MTTATEARAIYKALASNNTNGAVGEISVRILTLVATGETLQSAFNTILGAGTWEMMIDELYEALTA